MTDRKQTYAAEIPDGGASALVEAGLAHLAARDYPRAIATLTAAEALAPSDDSLLLALGVALQGARRHHEALDRFARVAERAPQKGAALLHSAFSRLALGQASLAQAAAQQVIALAPRTAAAHFALGQAEALLGRFDAAALALMTAIEIEPSAADFWIGLATLRRRFGDAAGAEDALRHAAQLQSPHDAAGAALAGRRNFGGDLKVWRLEESRAALGLAVEYLSRKSTFERLPFGEWTRTLAHQVEQGRQIFVVDDAERVFGYLGWTLTTEPLAEQWLRGLKPLSGEDCRGGDFVIINAWAADTKAAARLLVASGRDLFKDKIALYFKRFYRDGRVRATRLSVNAFVAAHIFRSDLKI